MRNCDTITCAVTPGAGCVVPSTASVFQAVGKTGFGENCCQQEEAQRCLGGCLRSNTCQKTGWCCPGNAAQASCGNGCAAEPCGSASPSNCGCETNANCQNSWANSCQKCKGCNQNNGNCGNANPAASCASACCKPACAAGCQSSVPAVNCAVSTTCGCAAGQCSSNGNPPAMVYEAEHQLCKMHEIEEAIRKGTLFSQLYMPMNGECADACGATLCDGQAEAFAAWELRLYLNTHPCDQQALQLFQQMACRAGEPNYASSFVEGCQSRWNWTDAPWPWEFNCACE